MTSKWQLINALLIRAWYNQKEVSQYYLDIKYQKQDFNIVVFFQICHKLYEYSVNA